MSFAVVALLAACSSGGAAEPTPNGPSARPTATQTPSPPTVLPPEHPGTSVDEGIEGAEALARYFLDLYGYVYNSGDLSDWERISHPDCAFCADVSKQVTSNRTRKRIAVGGEIEVHELSTEQLNDDYVAVRATVTQAGASLTEPDGTVVSQTEATTLEVAIGVARAEGVWLIHGLEALDEEPA